MKKSIQLFYVKDFRLHLTLKILKKFAQYGVFVGVSPFGMGANFNYNFNEKTNLSIGLGFAPEGEVLAPGAPKQL